MAQQGFIALTYDPSYQGESGGKPRYLEDPYARVEDVRCALDFLMTLPYVDEGRVGVLGICAGGGYAVNAALTEPRFKAVGTVVPVNVGRAFRQAQSTPNAVRQTLEAIGKHRTAEARGGEPRRDPWIPGSLADAEKAGIEDADLLDAVKFYRTSPWHTENSTNRLYFRTISLMLGFDAFNLVPQLLTQPLQVVVGGRLGTTFSFGDGKTLFELAPNKKDFFVVEGAGHYEMYAKSEYVDQAVERLAAFYNSHLR